MDRTQCLERPVMTTRSKQPVHHDLDAERAMCGAALHWPDRLEGVADDLAVEDFYDPAMRRIWQAVMELVPEGCKVDRLPVVDRATAAGPTLEAVDVVELMADALPPRREHVDI